MIPLQAEPPWHCHGNNIHPLDRIRHGNCFGQPYRLTLITLEKRCVNGTHWTTFWISIGYIPTLAQGREGVKFVVRTLKGVLKRMGRGSWVVIGFNSCHEGYFLAPATRLNNQCTVVPGQLFPRTTSHCRDVRLPNFLASDL